MNNSRAVNLGPVLVQRQIDGPQWRVNRLLIGFSRFSMRDVRHLGRFHSGYDNSRGGKEVPRFEQFACQFKPNWVPARLSAPSNGVRIPNAAAQVIPDLDYHLYKSFVEVFRRGACLKPTLELERIHLEFVCATALGLYSILKQCCFERVFALLPPSTA
ncbi:MAG: hypothetical protein JWM11_2356, partial [Planctomycetaceae bacterium]|nr:hypothetical protein [Planctomycetaceae bacterium]